MQGEVQVSTDGLNFYKDAIEAAFGTRASYGTSIKVYGKPEEQTRTDARYSPLRCTEVRRQKISGNRQ